MSVNILSGMVKYIAREYNSESTIALF